MVMSSSLLVRLKVFLRSYSMLNRHVISAPDKKVLNVPNINGIQKRGCTVNPGPPTEGTGKGGEPIEPIAPVREATKAFGKFAATKEEAFFYRKQQEQLEKIRKKLQQQEEQIAKNKAKQDPTGEE